MREEVKVEVEVGHDDDGNHVLHQRSHWRSGGISRSALLVQMLAGDPSPHWEALTAS